MSRKTRHIEGVQNPCKFRGYITRPKKINEPGEIVIYQPDDDEKSAIGISQTSFEIIDAAYQVIARDKKKKVIGSSQEYMLKSKPINFWIDKTKYEAESVEDCKKKMLELPNVKSVSVIQNHYSLINHLSDAIASTQDFQVGDLICLSIDSGLAEFIKFEKEHLVIDDPDNPGKKIEKVGAFGFGLRKLTKKEIDDGFENCALTFTKTATYVKPEVIDNAVELVDEYFKARVVH